MNTASENSIIGNLMTTASNILGLTTESSGNVIKKDVSDKDIIENNIALTVPTLTETPPLPAKSTFDFTDTEMHFMHDDPFDYGQSGGGEEDDNSDYWKLQYLKNKYEYLKITGR